MNQKPLIIAYKECRDEIINTLNGSGLPSFLLEIILNDLLSRIQVNVQNDYQTALKEYVGEDTEEKSNDAVILDPDKVDID